MAERYTRLFSLAENLYTTGAPVLIAAGVLLKDNQTGKTLAQLKFKSLSEKNIKALKVTIAASDVSGNTLTGVDEYQYLDLAVERNETFGQKQAIYLPNAVTRSIAAKCTDVIFEDGTAWKAAEDAIWNTLPEQETIDDCLKELAAQYQRDTSRLSKYALLEHEDLWLCTCGAINHNEEAACHRCNYEKAELREAMDVEGLQERKAEYDRKAAEEAEIRAKQAAERAEKKAAEDKVRRAEMKKNGILVTVAVLVIVITFVLTTKVFIPNSQYNKALALMDDGQYAEAITAFEAMDGYKDSGDKLVECRYGNAVALMESGQHTEAIAAFEALDGYGDSVEMWQQAIFAALKTAQPGDVATFSSIDWIVLAQEQSSILLIAKDGVANRRYKANWKYKDLAWAASDVREYLNSTFLETTLNNLSEHLTCIDGDKVSLLTSEQYAVYREYIPYDGEVWWLRNTISPKNKERYCAAVVEFSEIDSVHVSHSNDVRPIIMINVPA